MRVASALNEAKTSSSAPLPRIACLCFPVAGSHDTSDPSACATTIEPSCPNATASAAEAPCFITKRSRSDPVFQRQTTPSASPETIQLLSILTATALTLAACFFSVLTSRQPLVSQILIVMSALLDTRYSPLLLKARLRMPPVCPVNVRVSLPFARSQIRIVLSELPEIG